VDEEPCENSSQSAEASLVIAPGTTWRGVQIRLETIQEADLEVLAKQWNANLVRVHLGQPCGCRVQSEECLRAEGLADLDRLDWLLDRCETYGMRVVIDVGFFPGYSGYAGGSYGEVQDMSLYTCPAIQEELIRYWRDIASRYASRGDVIYGYDLLNEPHTDSVDQWLGLAKRLTEAIRAVDPYHTIVVEGIYGAHAEEFGSMLPTGDPNTIYSFHTYKPSEFTHQSNRLPLATYPTSEYNREYLEGILRPVVDFANRYDVRILAGEFGGRSFASADSSEAYMSDILELFEEHGFDYCYYAFRERASRSLEHVGRIDDAIQTAYSWYEGTSGALELFKEYLSRNDTRHVSEQIDSLLGTCVFDTSHWGTDQMAVRAQALDLAWRLESLCSVREHPTGPITVETLEGSDLLAVGWTDRPLTTGEIQAIHDHVEQGGALLFYCGSICGNAERSINRLLAPYGILFDPLRVCGEPPAYDAGAHHRFWSYTFNTEHPIGKHGNAFLCWSSATLDISAPAVRIALTAPNSWRDSDWNKQRGPGEQAGPFTVVASSELGDGRILVVAGNTFYEPCNWELLAPGVKWLLHREDLL